jgi:hypothetical protein
MTNLFVAWFYVLFGVYILYVIYVKCKFDENLLFKKIPLFL